MAAEFTKFTFTEEEVDLAITADYIRRERPQDLVDGQYQKGLGILEVAELVKSPVFIDSSIDSQRVARRAVGDVDSRLLMQASCRPDDEPQDLAYWVGLRLKAPTTGPQAAQAGQLSPGDRGQLHVLPQPDARATRPENWIDIWMQLGSPYELQAVAA